MEAEEDKPCPEKYLRHLDACYGFEMHSSYDGAVAQCEKVDARLVDVDPRNNKFIAERLKVLGGADYWIGSYLKGDRVQKKKGPSQCPMLKGQLIGRGSGMFSMLSCNSAYPFICQKYGEQEIPVRVNDRDRPSRFGAPAISPIDHREVPLTPAKTTTTTTVPTSAAEGSSSSAVIGAVVSIVVLIILAVFIRRWFLNNEKKKVKRERTKKVDDSDSESAKKSTLSLSTCSTVGVHKSRHLPRTQSLSYNLHGESGFSSPGITPTEKRRVPYRTTSHSMHRPRTPPSPYFHLHGDRNCTRSRSHDRSPKRNHTRGVSSERLSSNYHLPGGTSRDRLAERNYTRGRSPSNNHLVPSDRLYNKRRGSLPSVTAPPPYSQIGNRHLKRQCHGHSSHPSNRYPSPSHFHHRNRSPKRSATHTTTSSRHFDDSDSDLSTVTAPTHRSARTDVTAFTRPSIIAIPLPPTSQPRNNSPPHDEQQPRSLFERYASNNPAIAANDSIIMQRHNSRYSDDDLDVAPWLKQPKMPAASSSSYFPQMKHLLSWSDEDLTQSSGGGGDMHGQQIRHPISIIARQRLAQCGPIRVSRQIHDNEADGGGFADVRANNELVVGANDESEHVYESVDEIVAKNY